MALIIIVIIKPLIEKKKKNFNQEIEINIYMKLGSVRSVYSRLKEKSHRIFVFNWIELKQKYI